MLLTTDPKVTVALASDLQYSNFKQMSAVTGNLDLEMELAEILKKLPQRYKHFICTIHRLYLACRVVILGSQAACLEESIRGRAGWQKLGGASLLACIEESSCGAITPSSLCLSFPFCMKKNSGKEKGYWRGTHGHGHDRATVTDGLIHYSIIIENVLLRLSLLGPWMNCESWAQKTLCFQVGLRSVSCQGEDLKLCLYIWENSNIIHIYLLPERWFGFESVTDSFLFTKKVITRLNIYTVFK